MTHFVAGLGTSGTFMGTTRRLRELNPAIQCISMQPDSPFNGLEGLKHMATAIVPKIYDAALADVNIEMETERAYAMARRLGRKDGLLVGVSAAGAVGCGACRLREREAQGWARGCDCDDSVRLGGQVFERAVLEQEGLSDADGLSLCPTTKRCAAHGEETYPHECCGVLLGKA